MQASFGPPTHVIMPPRSVAHAVVRRPSKRSDGSCDKPRDEAEDQKITVEKIKVECKEIAEAAAEKALKKAQAASLQAPAGAKKLNEKELLDALNNITASQQQTREHVIEDSKKAKELQEEINHWRSRSEHNENQLGVERANTESLHKQLQASQGQQRRLEERLQQLEAAPVPSRHEDEAMKRKLQQQHMQQLQQLEQQLQQQQRQNQQLQQRLGDEQEERERWLQRCQEQEKIIGQQAASSSNMDAAAQERHAMQRKVHDLQEYVKQLEEQLWQEREERKMDKVTTPAEFLAMYKATERENLSHENCQLKVDNSRLRSDLEKCLEKLRAQASMPRGSIGGS
jgi:hypothetical protein